MLVPSHRHRRDVPVLRQRLRCRPGVTEGMSRLLSLTCAMNCGCENGWCEEAGTAARCVLNGAVGVEACVWWA